MTPKCDFCSGRPIQTWYDAPSFGIRDVTTYIVPVGYLGQWGACAVCSALIAAGQWEALTDRAVDTYLEAVPDCPPELRALFHLTVAEVYNKLKTAIVITQGGSA